VIIAEGGGGDMWRRVFLFSCLYVDLVPGSGFGFACFLKWS